MMGSNHKPEVKFWKFSVFIENFIFLKVQNNKKSINEDYHRHKRGFL